MVRLKRKTPKIEPWGQPPVTGLGEDQVDPTLTVIDLFVRKVAMSLMMGVEAPWAAKARRQC